MNNDQKNHLKAYGIAYKTIANDINVSWLLNYEGGSFLMKHNTLTEKECNVRGVKKVWNSTEIYNERRCNINNKAGYGLRYCYEDINDLSTLQFLIIHY